MKTCSKSSITMYFIFPKKGSAIYKTVCAQETGKQPNKSQNFVNFKNFRVREVITLSIPAMIWPLS